MKKFLIYTRSDNEKINKAVRDLAWMIRKKGGWAGTDLSSSYDAVISLGGDGTMVDASKYAVRLGLPSIGVNLGHLGYLCDLDEKNLEEGVERLLKDDFETERRMMLEGNSCDGKEFTALNDVVIASSAGLNIINLSVFIDNNFLCSYNCDGIIFATPTGSTAYNLSADGPIVDPTTEVILLNPVNAHTLNSRAIVLDPGNEISVTLNQRHENQDEEAMVFIDGEKAGSLGPGESFRVKRSCLHAEMIRFSELNFLQRISSRLNEV